MTKHGYWSRMVIPYDVTTHLGVIDLTGETPEVKNKYWVKELQLLESDYRILTDGSELNDRIIVARQSLLAKQFPLIN